MRKLNIWGLADEAPAPPEVRTFTDPRRPGEEWELCLVRPGLLEQAAIQETAEAYCAEYLGTGSEKGKRFLAPGGRTYPLNRGAIWEVSAVYCLQSGPGKDRYQWTDLLGIYLKRPCLWKQGSLWAGELMNAEQRALEEALGLGKPAPDPEEDEEEAAASPPSSSAALPRPTRRTPPRLPAATPSSAKLPTASAA